MIEVMKQNHQEVDVIDMNESEAEPRESHHEEEPRRMYEEAEHEEEANYEDAESKMTRKFIEGATKGISHKLKSKKGGGKY